MRFINKLKQLFKVMTEKEKQELKELREFKQFIEKKYPEQGLNAKKRIRLLELELMEVKSK